MSRSDKKQKYLLIKKIDEGLQSDEAAGGPGLAEPRFQERIWLAAQGTIWFIGKGGLFG